MTHSSASEDDTAMYVDHAARAGFILMFSPLEITYIDFKIKSKKAQLINLFSNIIIIIL
jgi:hypothetical protein